MHNDNKKAIEMTDDELLDMIGGFHFFEKKRHRERPPATTKYGTIPSATSTPTPMPSATPTPTPKYGVHLMYGIRPTLKYGIFPEID